MGRLVRNHSTNIDGLIDKLIAVSKNSKLKTITPGVINRTKSNCPNLMFKITTSFKGGYKLLARKGRSVQEVYIITDICKEELVEILNS